MTKQQWKTIYRDYRQLFQSAGGFDDDFLVWAEIDELESQYPVLKNYMSLLSGDTLAEFNAVTRYRNRAPVDSDLDIPF